MDQICIIRDLLIWLESHLDQALSLDNVAAKAGYSKWHLQRMFKEVTGQAIGSYIRARRLTKAAVALRLSSRSILDIAVQYHFDSQQTFTRAFKKQFTHTPAFYRRSKQWLSEGLCAPIYLDKRTLPQISFITVNPLNFIGMSQGYEYKSIKKPGIYHRQRVELWHRFLQALPVMPEKVYGIRQYYVNKEQEDELQIQYTTAVLVNEWAYPPVGRHFRLDGGEYARFVYEGPIEGLQQFIFTLYSSCLPLHGLLRDEGEDIECFHLLDEQGKFARYPSVYCEYFIPVCQ